MSDDNHNDPLIRIEQKLDQLLQIERMNAANIVTLYRRTTALAYMLEAISTHTEPRLPKAMRAEIDASVNPEYFETLAQGDPDEFVRRYGEKVLEILTKQGVGAISKIGDFSPLKSSDVTH